jgi:hypothetical protein
MRRLLVLLSLASLAVGFGSVGLGVVACGGAEKPPLTPDSVDMPTENVVEAGPPSNPAHNTPPR